MQFGFDTVISSINKAFELKKNFVTLAHLVIGIGALVLLSILGGLTRVELIYNLLSLVGAVIFYFMAIRMVYIITYGALQDQKTGKAFDYKEAAASFGRQMVTCLVVPILFIVCLAIVIALEGAILYGLSMIPAIGSIISAVLAIPLFILNFGLLIVIFFGGSVMFSIIIEGETNIIETIKALVNIVLQKFQSMLIYTTLASILTTTLSLFVLVIGLFSFIPATGTFGLGMLMGFMGGRSFMGGMGDNFVATIIMGANAVIILSFFLSFLVNIGISVNASIFLAVSKGLNLKGDINLNEMKDKMKNTMKDTMQSE